MTGVVERLPRLGVGHEAPNGFDCFADGTPPIGKPFGSASTGDLAAAAMGSPTRSPTKKKKAKKRTIDPVVLKEIHRKFDKALAKQGSSYKGADALFQQSDRDRSTTLDPDELRLFIRKTLRIPVAELSNDTIKVLYGFIDSDGSNAIEFSEFEHFLEHGAIEKHTEEEATRRWQQEAAAPRHFSVEPNPTAGLVRDREAEAPYLAVPRRLLRLEEAKSAAAAREKLVFDLAKQTAKGLETSLGVYYEMTSVANVLRIGLRHDHVPPQALDALPNADAVRRARLVVKAARAYHLRDVATLLDVQVPQRQTWGDVRTAAAASS